MAFQSLLLSNLELDFKTKKRYYIQSIQFLSAILHALAMLMTCLLIISFILISFKCQMNLLEQVEVFTMAFQEVNSWLPIRFEMISCTT